MPDGAPLWPRAERSRGATCPRAAPHQSAGQSNVADRQAGGCHYQSRHWLQGRHDRAASAQAPRNCCDHGPAASAPPHAPPLPPPRRRRRSMAGSGAMRAAAAGCVLVVLGRARRRGGRQAVPRAHALQGLGRARGVRAAAPPPLRACGAAAAAGWSQATRARRAGQHARRSAPARRPAPTIRARRPPPRRCGGAAALRGRAGCSARLPSSSRRWSFFSCRRYFCRWLATFSRVSPSTFISCAAPQPAQGALRAPSHAPRLPCFCA